MNPRIYKQFEKILLQHKISGKVLEVGAIHSNKSLLASNILNGCDKIGINLIGSKEFMDFKIIE